MNRVVSVSQRSRRKLYLVFADNFLAAAAHIENEGAYSHFTVVNTALSASYRQQGIQGLHISFERSDRACEL